MTQRRELWVSACFASALLLLSGPSCTPDERTLGVGLGAAPSPAAGSSESAAGASDSAGAAGNAGAEAVLGEAGESGAAGSPLGGSGGANPSSAGGNAGASAGGAGGTGAFAGNGGTLAAGGDGAGASASGPCGDADHNGVDDCAESLVQNSSFDNDVTPWTSAQWNSSNSHAAGASGSLLVLNDLPVIAETGFNLKAAEQCIPVTGDLTYRVAARVMIPAGQGAGFGGINLWIFANDGCKGTFVTGLSPALTQDSNVWTQLDAHFKMPTAARSMVVRLAATRPFAQEKLQVLFDDIVVKQLLP